MAKKPSSTDAKKRAAAKAKGKAIREKPESEKRHSSVWLNEYMDKFRAKINLWERVTPFGTDPMKGAGGRPPLYATPQDMVDAIVEYFEWSKRSPLRENKVFHSQGNVTHTNVKHERAMTINALQLFLEITRESYRKYKNLPGFDVIIQAAEQMIYDQKLVGAASNFYNANIISRELGLVDKTQVEVEADVKAEVITSKMTAKEASDAYAETLRGEG